jgi:hypothetical protein
MKSRQHFSANPFLGYNWTAKKDTWHEDLRNSRAGLLNVYRGGKFFGQKLQRTWNIRSLDIQGIFLASLAVFHATKHIKTR